MFGKLASDFPQVPVGTSPGYLEAGGCLAGLREVGPQRFCLPLMNNQPSFQPPRRHRQEPYALWLEEKEATMAGSMPQPSASAKGSTQVLRLCRAWDQTSSPNPLWLPTLGLVIPGELGEDPWEACIWKMEGP